MNRAVVSSYTSRTTAFASATGITDTTILGALNTFDLGLISNSLDTKMNAVYPFVGTTATTQKYNFMDARDLDEAFRLTFYGGGTFSSNGYQPNGTNAYAETYNLNVTNDSSIWYYSRTNNTTTSVEMGVWNETYSDTALFAYYGGNSGGYIKALSNGYSGVSWTATTSQGFFGTNRTSSILNNSWHNGVKKGTNTNTSSSSPTVRTLWIGCYHAGQGVESPSNKESAFSAISKGLTDGEASIFYNLVQTMQTTLGRQV
jgi:hypothetical protein